MAVPAECRRGPAAGGRFPSLVRSGYGFAQNSSGAMESAAPVCSRACPFTR
jgi:hypothetical protein